MNLLPAISVTASFTLGERRGSAENVGKISQAAAMHLIF
jgi:hypothetical protein